jgi:hypothetical protein
LDQKGTPQDDGQGKGYQSRTAARRQPLPECGYLCAYIFNLHAGLPEGKFLLATGNYPAIFIPLLVPPGRLKQ